MNDYKIFLSEKELPQEWYNIIPDLPRPLAAVSPPGHRPAHQPPTTWRPSFPRGLIEQELSPERWIPIPDEVQAHLPLVAAQRPCTGPGTWSRPSRPRPASTIRTNPSAPPAATSPTPPWPRPTTTRWRASSGWPPRPGPASGAAPCPWPATSSASSAPSTWSR